MQVRILLLDPNFVAVTGTATASFAKRGHAGSNLARNFISDQALVAQLEERRTSNPGLRGFDSCRELQLSLGSEIGNPNQSEYPVTIREWALEPVPRSRVITARDPQQGRDPP